MKTKANSYVAVFEAADPDDIAECPNPNVVVSKLPYGRVRLVGDYEDLMNVLTTFIGLTAAESDIMITELV